MNQSGPERAAVPWKRRVEIGDAVLLLGDALECLPAIGPVDAIITDPPYSERTHKNQLTGFARDGVERKPLGYSAWDVDAVSAFVVAANGICRGWIACMCDDVLAPAYIVAMRHAGRYPFAPLPYYAPGSRVRLSGDGPSSWTIWIVVSRTKAQVRWGTLPGGYVRQPGWDAPEKMGGKPVKLMEELVSDYSAHGDLVCDPCMGRGSTAIACQRLGRPFIGIERDPEEFERACERIENAQRQQPMFPEKKPEQEVLL
jgi:DNA methylase